MGTLGRLMCALCNSQPPFPRLKCCKYFSASVDSVGVAGPVTHSETLPKMKDAFGALSLSMLAKGRTAP